MELLKKSGLNIGFLGARLADCMQGFSRDRWILAAQALIVLELIAVMRAFALVSLIELFLFCLFLFYSPLRRMFLDAFLDLRILLIFVFWGWVVLAMFWSNADYYSRFDEVWSWRKVLLLPMAWVLFKDDRLKKISILTFTVGASVFMTFSWLGHLGIVSLDREASQLLENHSTQGVVFVVASLLTVLMIKHEKLSFWWSIMLLLLVSGMLSNIVFVLTGRTSYVSLLFMGGYATWFLVPRLRWTLVALVFIVTSVGLYVSDTSRSSVIKGLEEFDITISQEAQEITSMGIRWVYWGNTLQMISSNPILGSGSGGFKAEYAKTVENDTGWRAIATDDPHQQYLLIAGEQGLIGLMLFLGILFGLLVSQGGGWYRIAAIGVLLMTAINGMFNGHFGTFVEGRLFWIFMGILLSTTNPIHRVSDLRRDTLLFLHSVSKNFRWGLSSNPSALR